MELKQRAKKLRKDTLDLAMANHGSHFGAYFSNADILISLYDVVMKPEDKFVLSGGHGCFPLQVLLNEKGQEVKKQTFPLVDVTKSTYGSTGSLGHGLPIAVGMAFARKLQKKSGRVYVLMGDGECQEGTTWESLGIAGSKSKLGNYHKPILDNLVAIVNSNGIQGSGFTDKVIPIIPSIKLAAKEMGWEVSEVDGHDYNQLISTLEKQILQPHLIIANTVKGKGISFMENQVAWHSKIPTEAELKQAYEELK